MFWGVTLESGKRYSQKVTESYHLSMACLEPLQSGNRPVSKEVSVMIEHGHAEYVLCVLEYGRVMQVNLDIIFDCGEVVTFFLGGEGVVHLTGYALPETDDDDGTLDKANELSALNIDDEEEEDDEDWTPAKEEKNSENSDESEESEDEEFDTDSEPDQVLFKKENEVGINQNQLSETNEDETDDARGKRKKNRVKGSKAKKQKVADPSPIENGNLMSDKIKSKKLPKAEVNHVNAEDSDDDNLSAESEDGDRDGASEDESVDYSTDEEPAISSVGRTPMPKREVISTSSLGESPDLPHRQNNSAQKQKKKKLKAQDISSPDKISISVSPKNTRLLTGNVRVEDIRIGSGPPAKNGKFIFLHYVGKLTNGKVFESCEAPKQPYSFRLGRGEVIKGLEIGVEGMKVGGKRKITVPENMAYGSQPVKLIPPKSTLIFTVELKSVK